MKKWLLIFATLQCYGSWKDRFFDHAIKVVPTQVDSQFRKKTIEMFDQMRNGNQVEERDQYHLNVAIRILLATAYQEMKTGAQLKVDFFNKRPPLCLCVDPEVNFDLPTEVNQFAYLIRKLIDRGAHLKLFTSTEGIQALAPYRLSDLRKLRSYGGPLFQIDNCYLGIATGIRFQLRKQGENLFVVWKDGVLSSSDVNTQFVKSFQRSEID